MCICSMLFTVALLLSFFPFPCSKLSCVGQGGEEWPTAVSAVLYKIKVCFGVRNESLALSPGTDNHLRIYCPLFTLLQNTQTYIHTSAHTHTHTHLHTIGLSFNIEATFISAARVGLHSDVELNVSAREGWKHLSSRLHNTNINTG